MTQPTPFHPRTSKLCKSMRWKDWGGYYSTLSYENQHESEYAAIRYSAGLMDVTPLFKYEIYGPDAGRFLNRIIAKNIETLKVGQTTYCCWTDHSGKVLDDGTVTHLREDYFRVTAAEPCFYWFKNFERGHRVTIEDSTDEIGTLSLQGPRSREILLQLSDKIADLKFFHAVETNLDGVDVTITRTGYTGDLGYEIWIKNSSAVKVYDAISSVGQNYGLVPFGLDALDVSRVEAGFIMNGVDYFSANHCLTESRKSTPFELGLGWTVNLKNQNPFVGREALIKMKQEKPKWSFIGLVLDWDEQERLFAKYNLPPQICGHAWRNAVPVYSSDGRQIGQATSGAWSPILKLNLALASIETPFASPGEELYIEYTVEYVRHKVKATVTKTPFFNPERKRQSKWP